MNRSAFRSGILSSILATAGGLGAQAQTSHVWDGGGANNNWSTSANWSPDGTPPNPTTNFIALAGTTRTNTTVDQAWTIFGLILSNNAGAFTLGGSNLTLTANSSGNATNVFTHNGALGVVVSNNLILPTTPSNSPRRQFAINGAGGATFSGIITNTGAEFSELWIRGTGSGVGTFNGRITIGTSKLFRTDNPVTWVIGSTNNQWGITELDNTGTLRIAAANALPTNTLVQFDTGNPRLDLNNFNQTVGGLTGVGTIRTGTGTGSTLTVSDLGATSQFGGVFVENGRLVKTGPGRLILSSATGTTITGNVTVAEGVLQAGTNRANQFFNTLGLNVANRTIFINSGATLELQSRDTLPTLVSIALAGTITNNGFNRLGPLTMSGALVAGGIGNSATFQNYTFDGNVAVTGTAPSTITGSQAAFPMFHLERAGGVTFTVADVTGNANADLFVSAQLTNRANNAGAGALIKAGPGTMRLDANNPYTGDTTINAGTLALGSTGTLSNTAVQVGSGALLDVTAHELAFGSYTLPPLGSLLGNGSVTGSVNTASGTKILPGTAGTAGTLTFLSDVVMGSGAVNTFDLSGDPNAIGSGTNDLLVATGANFEPLSATVAINPLAPLASGSYRLVNYTGSKGTTFAAPVLGNTTRGSWTLDESVANQISLVVAAGTNQSLVWNPVASATWDVGTSANWTNPAAGTQDSFFDGDSVLFDDGGAWSNLVALNTTVRPTAVTVNSSSNYTLQGTGAIADYASVPASLTKDGSGTLVMALANTYSGPTIVSNGTLQIGNGGTTGQLGTAAVAISPSGTLAFFRNDGGASPLVISNAFTGSGTVFFNGVATNNQSVYQPTNNNLGFTGGIHVLASRLQPVSQASLGGSSVNVIAGEGVSGGGQLWLQNAGTYTNPVSIAGVGWFDSATNHGAIRFRNGANLAGPVTLTNHARVGAFDGESGVLSGLVSGPYELEFFGRNAAANISVASPSPANYAATRVSIGTALATNANAFSTGPMTLNGGILRVNGFNFSFSNLTSTAVGGVIENRSATTQAVVTVGGDDTSTTFLGSFQNGSTQALGLAKIGTGALTLFNNAATGVAQVSQGTLVISNGSWSGPLTVAAGATAVAQGGAGLLGQYYRVAAVSANGTNVNFASLTNLNRYLAAFNPNLLYQSTAATTNLTSVYNANFDFGAIGNNFPPGFSTNAANFQVRWVGRFLATNAGVHAFSTASDDGSTLFIDGALVVNNNTNQGVVERTGTVSLAVGYHDIVVAYFDGTGGYGMYANVVPPGGTRQPLANLVLSSGPGIGSLSGPAGGVLAVSNGLLTIAQSLPGTFDGDISGNGGLYKIGNGTLVLNGSATFADSTVIGGGLLVANQSLGTGTSVLLQAGGALGGTGAIAGAVSAQDGAILHEATPGVPGRLTLSADLTLSGGTSNMFDFSATTNDLLAVGGLLTPNGAVVLVNPSAALGNGQYTVATYGTLGGTYGATVYNMNPLASGPKRLSLDYATLGEVRLAVNDGKTLRWNSATNGSWDVQNSSHWNDGVALTNEAFLQGDAVVFDDTPGVTQVVTIASGTNVWPASITVNTDTNAFALQMAGALLGHFAVVKNGTNTLTMNDTTGGAGANQNLGSGGVTVNSGKLILLGQNDGGKAVGPGLVTINPAGVLQTDSNNTLGQQQTGNIAPLLLNGGRFRPNRNNHLNQFTLQNNAVVERYDSANAAGLDFYALTGTPAQIHVLATSATITNDARMTILGSLTNTIFNIVDSAPAIDAEFSAAIFGSTTRFLVLTNTGTLLLSGPNDNNTLAGIVENGTLLLGKTGATIRAFGAGIPDAVTIRGTGSTVRLVGPGPDQIVAGSGLTMHGGTFDLNGWSESYNGLNGTNGTVRNSAAGTVATNSVGESNGSGVFDGLIQDGGGVLAFRKLGTGTQQNTATNTYTGPTILAGGTLIVDALANGGSPSQIGAANAGSSNLVFAGGTLRYIGASTASDRGFTLAGNATLDLSNDVVLAGAVTSTANSVMLKRGLGTLTLSNPGQNLLGLGTGISFVNNGRVVFSGGPSSVYNTSNELCTGGSVNPETPNYLDVSNGTINVGTWLSLSRGNGVSNLDSIVTMTGGRINAAQCSMGFANAVANYRGRPQIRLFNDSILGLTNQIYVGESLGSTAIIQVQDTAQLLVGTFMQIPVGNAVAGATAATGLVTVSGSGQVKAGTTVVLGNAAGTEGRITIQGSGLFSAGTTLTVGNNATGNGSIDVDGGILAAGNITRAAGTGIINFNGGTLRPNTNSPVFLQGLSAANILSGGMGIDASTFSNTINQNLVDAGGGGGLTKTGAGFISLGGSNTYTGATAVNNGTLYLNGTHAGAGAFTVASNATLWGTGTISVASATVATGGWLGVRSPGPTGTLTIAEVTLDAGAQVSAMLSGTSPTLRVTGDLNTSSSNLMQVVALSPVVAGTNVLISYGGTWNGNLGHFLLYALPNGSQGELVDNAGNKTIDLVVSNAGTGIKWDGAVDATWKNLGPLNWKAIPSGNATPFNALDTVLFDDTATGSYTVNVTEVVTPMSVLVTNDAQDYTFTGSGIGGVATLTKAGAGVLTVSAANSFSGGTVLNAGTLALANAAALGPSAQPVTLNGGRLQLATDSSVNTYNATVRGGSVLVSDRATAGAGITHILGTLQLLSNVTLTVTNGANVTGGSADVTFLGRPDFFGGGAQTLDVGTSSTLNLAGSATGGTASGGTLNKNGEGILMVGGNNGWWDFGSMVVNNGTVVAQHVNAINDASSTAITLGTNATFRFALDGILANHGNVTLNGNASIVVDRATPGPGVTQNNGTLLFASNYTLNVASGTNVTSGTNGMIFFTTTLAANGTINVLNPTGGAATLMTVTGLVTQTGTGRSLTKIGNGTLLLRPPNPCNYSGGTVVNGGTLSLNFSNGGANQGTIGGALTINTGATVRTAVEKGIGFANAASGGVTVITINGGLLEHTGANGMNGGQTVFMTAGEIRSNGGVPSTNSNSYRVSGSGSNPIIYVLASSLASLMSGRVALDTTGKFDVQDGAADIDLLVTAAITDGIGAGSPPNGLMKTNEGTMVITGPNTYSLFTLVNGGTLQLGTNDTTATLGRGTVTNDARLVLNLASGTISNLITGTGLVVQAGSGALTLPLLNNYSGGTQVSNGTLIVNGAIGAGAVTVAAGATLGGTGTVNGSVTSEGVVAPGSSAGLLNFAQDYTQGSSGALNIEIGGSAGAGVDYDELVVAGTANLDGALNVSLINAYAPTTNDVFVVMASGTRNGTFATTNLPALGGGKSWNVQYLGGLVVLSIVGAPAGYDLYALQITNAADRGYQADPDADGYANLLEYATGGDPTNSDQVARMNGTRTNGVLALRFTRATNAVDATYYVEGSHASTNDAIWTGIAVNSNGLWSGAATVSETGSSPVNVVVEDTDPAATNRFLRLRITRP